MKNVDDFTKIAVSEEIKEFFHHWKALNKEYKKMFPKGVHLPFPDKVQKKMVLEYLNSELENKVSHEEQKKGKSYDFDDNTELKSVTKLDGVVPFKATQIDCKRILFMVITEDGIICYDIIVDSVLNAIREAIHEAEKKGHKQASIHLYKLIENNTKIPKYQFQLEDNR